MTKLQTVDILGTEYEIIIKKYKEEEAFQRGCIKGFCDSYKKQIIVCDPATFEGWENEDAKVIVMEQNETIRHEIIHAFLNESGLSAASGHCDAGWADNEEMIDWFTLQFPKIAKVMTDIKVL
jgi:hypothetical protein